MLHAAVQEERQRAKEKSENEVESTSCVNEDMPVEKILEAEEAVEPKTDTYIESNLGVPSNSVRVLSLILQQVLNYIIYSLYLLRAGRKKHVFYHIYACSRGFLCFFECLFPHLWLILILLLLL